MTSPRERTYYIPPDVDVNSDGTISQEDWVNVYRLDNNWDAFNLSETGMGMPPVNYIDQQGPQQHGITLLDYRLQPRIIQYVHIKPGGCRDDYWDNRDLLLNMLRPNRQTDMDDFSLGRLRRVRNDGSIRDIYAMIERGPEFRAKDPERWNQFSITETLRFICPSPIWFDPAAVNLDWTVDVVSGLIFFEPVTYENHLVFPDTALFGTDLLAGNVSATYEGTWVSYPTITIVGPANNTIIQNTTLGLKIALDYEIATGEIVTITTEPGNRTVTNFAGDNLIGTLTEDSDLEFYVAPHPIAPNGINQFSVSASGGTVGISQLTLSYYTRYIGI